MANVALKVKRFFSKGHERTIKAKKNIAISLLLKGISIVIGFVLIPMTISYVNTTQYGIWLTLSSIISWFSFFDIGLGNGLKNKLAEANAIGDKLSARIYISTTYCVLIIISSILFVIFFIGNKYINWQHILNTAYDNALLSKLALIVFGVFCIQFVLQLLNTILTANHEPSKVSLLNVIGQSLCLLFIFYLTTHNTNGTLLSLVLVLAVVPIIVQFFASIYLYKGKKYKIFAPSFKFIEFKYAKQLLNIGGIFFVLQMGALVLFQTDNIVITQLFGPEAVTTFNITYKLFSAIIMAFSIVITPFWSAYTDAYSKKDFKWISETLLKMQKYWVVLVLICFLAFIASPYLYKLWLQDAVQIPMPLSFVMALYVISYSWQTIHVYLLNGIGKIKLQLYLVIISAIINIPLAIFLGKYFGIVGVTLSNIIVNVFIGLVVYVQCKKIIGQSATGIWNK